MKAFSLWSQSFWDCATEGYIVFVEEGSQKHWPENAFNHIETHYYSRLKELLAKHAFEGTRDEYAKKVKAGDIVVGGRNFGCGSSREHAPHALIGGGVNVVVAQSFARIFFRNAINVGVLPVVCKDADKIADGAKIVINLKKGIIEADGKQFKTELVPEFMQGIIDAGGLVDYAKNLTEVPVCTR